MMGRNWMRWAAVTVGLPSMRAVVPRADAASLWPPQNVAWTVPWKADKTDPVDATGADIGF